MPLKTLFWNIWLENQIKGKENSEEFLSELKRVIDETQPNVIGLNEVLQNVNAKTPFILDFLEEIGYKYTKFAPASPFTDDWIIGAAVASKTKPIQQENVVISGDVPAEKRGYEGYKVEAVFSKFASKDGASYSVGVAHPMHLRLRTLANHKEAISTLRDIAKSSDYSENLILGGDFNESVIFPGSFRRQTKEFMNFRTGTLLNPTWRAYASNLSPLRINYDHIYWSRSKHLKLKDFYIVNSSISDHKPLFAEFGLI